MVCSVCACLFNDISAKAVVRKSQLCSLLVLGRSWAKEIASLGKNTSVICIFIMILSDTMFGKLGEMKEMYSKYKKLQDKLKNLIIRAKQGSYTNTDGEVVEGAVVVDITGEMKLRDISINDLSLIDVAQKDTLEQTIKDAFIKAQAKAQEVVQEQTKEILGFDPSQLAGMMWGWGGIPGLS